MSNPRTGSSCASWHLPNRFLAPVLPKQSSSSTNRSIPRKITTSPWPTDSNLPEQKSSHEKRLHTDRSAGVSSSSSSSSSSDVWLVVRSSTPPTLSSWTGDWSHFWCIPCQSGVTGKGFPRTVPFFFAPPVSLLGRKILLPLLPSCCSCWWGLCSGFLVTVSLSYDVPTWTTFKSQ